MASINPYAGDYITFPAGTPAGVMSQYYNYILNQRSREANKPEWWETLLGVANQTLNPFLQALIAEPFKEDFAAFQTDQDIRKSRALKEQDQTNWLAQEDYKRNQLMEDQSNLGTSIQRYLDIAAQKIPQTVIDTGAFDPYGDYNEPLNTGAVPSNQPLEGTEISTPQTRTVTATNPEQRISTEEALRQFAAKYPTSAGVLQKFLGADRSFEQMDPLRQAKRRADIEAAESLARQRDANAFEKERLLAQKEGLLKSQSELNVARTRKTGIDASRVQALARSEDGRAALREYLIQNQDTMSDEEFQRIAAILQGAQLRETPSQTATRTQENARVMAGRPTAASTFDRMLEIKARIDAGTASPQEIHEFEAFKTVMGITKPQKAGDPLKEAIGEFLRGELNPGGTSAITLGGGKPLSLDSPEVQQALRQGMILVRRNGKLGIIRPEEFQPGDIKVNK